MSNASDVIVCPPDRQVLVEYLHLRKILATEVANAVPACQQQLPQLLQLLELICHMEYLQESRLVKSAMTHTKPMISNDEQHSMAASCGDTGSEQEMLLLEHLISLLLEARYFPLSAQEWVVAQRHQFTFDIPVQIDWSVLDDQLLTSFWDRQAYETAAASTGSNIDNSSSAAEPNLDHTWRTHWQPHSRSSAPLLDRSQLPAFFDRMLVFHRGVGVATAEGLYLDKKLDLLLGYLLVGPVTSWLDKVMRSLGLAQQDAAAALTASEVQQRAAATTAAGSTVLLAGWGAASPEALSHQNDDEELRPFTSADLAHQYARLVVRSSLRSLMPGPKQVLQKLLQRLVLLEPTFRDVVVVYRASSPAATGEAEASAAQAADSAMTAAVYAASGTPTLAIDAIVEAAKAAAEAKSVDSSDQQQQQQQQQRQPQVQTIDTSRRVKLNPSNIIVKSFSEVALADLELVFPSKKAEVRPTTLVRSAVIAMGAVGAVAAYIQQMSSMHWSLPVVMSAAAVVAGRAIKVLSTVRNQQASLNSVMMTMQYDAARDSQEGVVIKLIDDLREQHLKEAALAYSVMTTQAAAVAQWQQKQQRDSRSKASTEHDSGSGADLTAVVFSSREIDAACEDFLLQRFGLKTDFMIDETLPRMVSWGLLQQRAPDQFSLVPPSQALEHLQAHWQAMQQQAGGAAGATPANGAWSRFNSGSSGGRSSSRFCAADEFVQAAPAAQHSTAVQAISARHYKRGSTAQLRCIRSPVRWSGRRCAAPAVGMRASLSSGMRWCV